MRQFFSKFFLKKQIIQIVQYMDYIKENITYKTIFLSD